MSRTTIAVDKETRNELYYKKRPDESYDEYLKRAIIGNGEEPDDE